LQSNREASWQQGLRGRQHGVVVCEVKLRQPKAGPPAHCWKPGPAENPTRRSLPLPMNASRSPRRSPRGAGASNQRVFHPGSSFASLPSTTRAGHPGAPLWGAPGPNVYASPSQGFEPPSEESRECTCRQTRRKRRAEGRPRCRHDFRPGSRAS